MEDTPPHWSKLTDDLLDSIFQRLCTFDIGSLRCVCTRFRSITSSHKFLQMHSQTQHPAPYLLMVDHFDRLGFEKALDPGSKNWRRVSLSFLYHELDLSFHAVASNGGLLALGSGRVFHVCNPITKSWNKLPKVPQIVQVDDGGDSSDSSYMEDCQRAFGLRVDKTSGTYELIIVYNEPESGRAQSVLFNSSIGSWKAATEPPKSDHCWLRSGSIVACNKCFYSLWQRGASLLVRCYSEEEIWTEFEGPDYSPLLSAHLIDRHGQLIMVGGAGRVWLSEGMFEFPISIRIWELDIERKNWKELTRMPDIVLQEFNRTIEFEQLKCVGKDDVVYMMSPGSQVLMLEFSTGLWQWLERDYSVDLNFTGFVLEPSLSI